ncbi:hypothetical protein SUGI_1199360 [Cryptomeria japonica]|nr:hypothetical protein SUGI_1199360 [Cryptomeria japonica]
MGRAPCCSKVGLHRGPWTAKEDMLLTEFIEANGEGQWRALPKKAGLLRCGKSCRLRWMNYLRPDIKRGNITSDEEELVIRLHRLLGNRWSLIAGRLPGRTDNEIKNFWNTHLSKKLTKKGIDPKTHQPLPGKEEAQETSDQVKSDENSKRKRRVILESDSKQVNKGHVQPIHLPKANRFIAFPRSTSTSDLTGLSLTKNALESQSNVDNLDPQSILPVSDCFPWPCIDDDENWTVSNFEHTGQEEEEEKRINLNPNPISSLQLHDDQNTKALISQQTNSDNYVHSETKMAFKQLNKPGKSSTIMLQEVYEEYLELLQEESPPANERELISDSNGDENVHVFSEGGLSSMWDCLQGDDELLNNAATETALSLQ